MRKEIINAKNDKAAISSKLDEYRDRLKLKLPVNYRPSAIIYTIDYLRKFRMKHLSILNNKLSRLSLEQDKPLFTVNNTVICYELDSRPPKYVLDTLALGPKNSILDRFDQNTVLAELDSFVTLCNENEVPDNVVTDINVKTLAYIKKCKKQKSPRNLMLTKQYLKSNNLLAVPFDKGVGFCIMKKSTYDRKLAEIYNLPQFEKYKPPRKNAKNLILKEEEIVCEALEELKKENKISEKLFNKLKPIGSQPPRLYGLAKIHKNNVPLRPVLSMPGSSYYKIAKKVSKWLAVVPECQINTSSKEISESLGDIVLDENSEIVSFDIVSLYTNVPVDDAITTCADLLYDGDYPKPPVDKETFIKLLEICSKNVIMLTNDGFYRQINGLAMGSPPAPMLANGWLSSFESTIRKDSKVYHRYMDDILKDMKKNEIDQTLTEINELDDNLKFTLERESNGTIPFLDMRIIRKERTLESTWYTKPTDTGLKMNFHALAPLKYKRSAVIGMVHRIFRACSTKRNFDESLNQSTNHSGQKSVSEIIRRINYFGNKEEIGKRTSRADGTG